MNNPNPHNDPQWDEWDDGSRITECELGAVAWRKPGGDPLRNEAGEVIYFDTPEEAVAALRSEGLARDEKPRTVIQQAAATGVESYREFLELLVSLHVLYVSRSQDDWRFEEAVQEMDRLWDRLSNQHKEAARRVTAALNDAQKILAE